MRDVLLRLGHRALLAVPLISEDHIVGGLVVNRREPGEFTPEVIDLLRTFATQSALAIQNARLFRDSVSPATRKSPGIDGAACGVATVGTAEVCSRHSGNRRYKNTV